MAHETDVFICYRRYGAQTAKLFKRYLVAHNFPGKVWYSDSEINGNYKLDPADLISEAECAVMFIDPDFTKDFLSSENMFECITAREVLEIIDLADKAKSFPEELSGGQQQRVTIGRAIANNPKLLIADEPTGNLDPERSNEILELLEKINASGTTVIMVTHDINLVNKYKKRTIKLETGHVVSDSKEGGYVANV